MFKFYPKSFMSTVLIAASTSTIAFAAQEGVSNTYENGKRVIDGGVMYPVVNGKTSAYHINEETLKGGYTYGKKATDNEIKAWDIDVMPDGTGLPEGSGTVEEGDEVYEAKCVSCHGDFGSGSGMYPSLAKGNAEEGVASLTHQRVNPDADGPIRVFGTYWPQASTLWWYIKTGMPHAAPMSLTDDEVYALCAYMLSINEITIDGEELDDEYELDREKFLKIRMPNKDGFVPNIDGPKGTDNVREYFSNPKNYGAATTRCMKDCFEGEPVLARIQTEINDFSPPLSTARELPKTDASAAPVSEGAKIYEASCAVCHATDAMGAPALGDKKAWEAVLKKGIDTVYNNAMMGINAMPPKGGNANLTDDQLKATVDYMIDQSK
ncbi:MAG: c-type cytochrome [Sulfurovum sp.]|nr:c-type cytochrome [Sulfurovum sp.]MDD3602301.1 c-type cytochrome [Sulfurovum sp.]